MSDEPWFVDRACRGTYYPPEAITSSVHWATGYTGPASLGSRKATGNSEDWDHARQAFYLYLTGRDYVGGVVAAEELARNFHFHISLSHLGQVLHLLQDMAVPSHVRNDFLAHLEWKGIGSSTFRHPTQWVYERFEEFVKMNGGLISGGSGGALEEKSPTSLWNTNNFTGSNPEISLDSRRIGLAEYTNVNFVSKNTLFSEGFLNDGDPSNDSHHHPYPRKSSTNVQQYLDGVLHPEVVIGEDQVPDTSFYIAKTGDGQKIAHFLKLSYLSKPVRDYFDGSATLEVFYRTFLLDEECLKEYAALLLPKAVGYSAALLEYFFRGTFEIRSGITKRDSSGNIAGVDLWVKNGSFVDGQPESMESGTISVAFSYLPEGGTEPVLEMVKDAYAVAGQNDPINNQFIPLSVNFPNPIPLKGREVRITLVYRGKLGNEDGAVAARVIPLTSKIAYSGQPGCGTNPSFLYTIHPDGANDTQVTDADEGRGYAWRATPSWSADGRFLAFNGITSDNRYEIVVVDLTSDQPYPGNIKQVLWDSQCHYIDPSISPDGTRLVAQRQRMRHPPDESDLYNALVVFDLNTGSWSFPGGIEFWRDKRFAEQPKWSPTGDRIVFQHMMTSPGSSSPTYNIWSIDPEGTQLIRITDEPFDSRWPAWSANGEKVLFASKRDGGETYDMWLADRTGGNARQVADWGVDCVSFSTSPDGERIVFQIVGGWLYTMNLDGTVLRDLFTTGCSGTPAWSPYVFEGSGTP